MTIDPLQRSHQTNLEGLAIVTGAGSGLGREIASRLALEGVAVVSGSLEFPCDKHSAVTQFPFGGMRLNLDVRDPSAVDHFFSVVDLSNLPLKYLINCAGVSLFRPLLSTTVKEWQCVIDTNLSGSFHCCRAAIPRMIAGGGGRIINIGSIADHITLSGNGAYSVSKFGLRALSSAINEEHCRDGIRSTLVSLGATATELWNSAPEFSTDDMLLPADVAAIIVDICKTPLNIRLDELKILPERGVL